jgi:diaminobutyrate-2-oxoglutarate transaminase
MNRYSWIESVESSARTYASTFRTVFQDGLGMVVRDTSGREIIDCLACAGALPLGHNHPEIREQLVAFITSGHIQQALDLSTPAKFRFLEELYSTLPPALASNAKVHFCGPSGSDAVEAAMKLVRHATRRHSIIAFHGAYHGMTSGALGAMGNLVPKTGINTLGSAVHFVPFPYRYRCPFGTNGENTDQLSIGYLRTVLSDPESGITKPAGVLVEVVQGEGGCIPASVEWLRDLRTLTREFDIPLIVDEVQTGFGRTGRMFAFERAEIVPDVLVLSKALGGGHPLAALVYDARFDTWPRGMHAGTFRGNQIAMVAGRVTMEIIRRDRLDRRAEEMGAVFAAGLRQLATRYPSLGDVRGQGLMIGVEVVRPAPGRLAGAPDGELAGQIKLAAFDHGLLIETGGRNGAVLRFLPPLIISNSEIAEILLRLERSVLVASQTVSALRGESKKTDASVVRAAVGANK